MTGTVSAAQMSRSVATVGETVVPAGYAHTLGNAALGLIISAAAGDFTGIAWLLIRLPHRRLRQLTPLRPRRVKEDLHSRRAVALGVAATHTLIAIAGQSPLWIVSLTFGPTCASWHAFASRIVLAPGAFVGATVTGVMGSQRSVEHRQGKDISRKVTLTIAALTTVDVLD